MCKMYSRGFFIEYETRHEKTIPFSKKCFSSSYWVLSFLTILYHFVNKLEYRNVNWYEIAMGCALVSSGVLTLLISKTVISDRPITDKKYVLSSMNNYLSLFITVFFVYNCYDER
jgi:hypothetical protein